MNACIPRKSFASGYETKYLSLWVKIRHFLNFNTQYHGGGVYMLTSNLQHFFYAAGGLWAQNSVHMLISNCLMECPPRFFLTLKGGSSGMPFIDRGGSQAGNTGH